MNYGNRDFYDTSMKLQLGSDKKDDDKKDKKDEKNGKSKN